MSPSPISRPLRAISALTRREAPKPPEMLTTISAICSPAICSAAWTAVEDRMARRVDVDDDAVPHAARDLMADADDARRRRRRAGDEAAHLGGADIDRGDEAARGEAASSCRMAPRLALSSPASASRAPAAGAARAGRAAADRPRRCRARAGFALRSSAARRCQPRRGRLPAAPRRCRCRAAGSSAGRRRAPPPRRAGRAPARSRACREARRRASARRRRPARRARRRRRAVRSATHRAVVGRPARAGPGAARRRAAAARRAARRACRASSRSTSAVRTHASASSRAFAAAEIDGEDRRAARDAERREDRLRGLARSRPSTETFSTAKPTDVPARAACASTAAIACATIPVCASHQPPALNSAIAAASPPAMTTLRLRRRAGRCRGGVAAGSRRFRNRMPRSPPSSAPARRNRCPACRAISGTSEVGVMPGWVLTSSSTMRPGSPAVSS